MRPEPRRSILLLCFAVASLLAARPIPTYAAGSCGNLLAPESFVQSGDGDESGIGGTGHHDVRPDRMTSPGDDSESGIGGTGIFGTVTDIDRLCVNGLEIRVSDQVLAQSSNSGISAPLAVGKIVWIRARESADGLVAEEIQIQPALAGAVESIASDGQTFVVAGQTVALPEEALRGPGLASDSPKTGEWVVVHGLRDQDDRLIATRIEANPNRRIQAGVRMLAVAFLEGRSLRALSIEGYVRGDREGPRLAGLSLESAPTRRGIERGTLRPGRHLLAEGRISSTGAFLVERSVHLERPTRTAPVGRETLEPRERKERAVEPAPERGPGKPPSDSPPRSNTNRPRPEAMERRPARPDIKRPRSRPQIDRPTSLERLRPES